MTKKGRQKCPVLKWEFVPYNGFWKIWTAKMFSVPPKFGAKSPPMLDGDRMQGNFVA